MNAALALLIWLRFRGWLRRLGRNLRTVKGILFALVGALVLLTCLSSWFFTLLFLPANSQSITHVDKVQQIGPVGLFALCLLNLLTQSSERAVVVFSPAEVNLLFSGPFSRRQLLAYKLTIILISCFILAAVLMFGYLYIRPPSVSLTATYFGLVLTLFFTNLFSMTLGFIASTIGARAYNRGRKMVLGVLLLLTVLAVIGFGGDTLRQGPNAILERLEATMIGHLLIEPFRWFMLAVTAPQFWPDFVRWGSLSAGVDVFLVILIFALDAQYLESAAIASERLYAQLQRARRGGAAAMVLGSTSKTAFTLPSLGWWGGAGPIAWRQLVAVPRSRAWIVVLFTLVPLMVIPLTSAFHNLDPNKPQLATAIPITLGSQVLVMTIFLSFLFAFDFRGDVERIDVLKSLPIGSLPIALGQLVTPVLCVSLIQTLALVILAIATPQAKVVMGFLAAIPFLLPFNVILFGLDNLMFLLFPTRTLAPTAGDLQVVGRQMLLSLARVFVLGIAAGIAAVAALLVYFLVGESLILALAVAWIILSLFAAGVVPLVAWAFRRFDVARDTPP